jgi:hypothetical protein
LQRVQIVLASGRGETYAVIAKRMGLTGMTVGKWRKRYQDLLSYTTRRALPLLADLDVAIGSVIAESKPSHGHQGFLSFLRRIGKEVPTHLGVHLIVDN